MLGAGSPSHLPRHERFELQFNKKHFSKPYILFKRLLNDIIHTMKSVNGYEVMQGLQLHNEHRGSCPLLPPGLCLGHRWLFKSFHGKMRMAWPVKDKIASMQCDMYPDSVHKAWANNLNIRLMANRFSYP